MPSVKEFNRFLMIAGMALTVNILLFTGLPNILPENDADTGIQSIQGVDFLRQPPEKDMAEKKSAHEEPPPPEPPRVVPKKTITPVTPQPSPQLNMQLPSFDFDVSPDMTAGVPVSAPPAPAPTPSAAPAASFKEFYGMDEVDQAPVATEKSRPAYPYRARRLNLNGEVDIKFMVDSSGRVSQVTVLRATPPKLFDQSVRKAVSNWRFAPGKVRGRPVNTWVTTTIVFRIDSL